MGDLAVRVAILVVRRVGRRSGVGERHGGDNTGGLALLDGALGDVFLRHAVVGHAQHAVLHLDAGGHGGTCRSRVGDDALRDVVVGSPRLLRVVGTALGEGGLGQAVEVLVALYGLTLELLRALGAELTVDEVLGLAGLVEVVVGDVAVAHAVADHDDDVLRASRLSRLCRGDDAGAQGSGGQGGDGAGENAHEKCPWECES